VQFQHVMPADFDAIHVYSVADFLVPVSSSCWQYVSRASRLLRHRWPSDGSQYSQGKSTVDCSVLKDDVGHQDRSIIMKAKIIVTLYIKNVAGALYRVNYNENTLSMSVSVNAAWNSVVLTARWNDCSEVAALTERRMRVGSKKIAFSTLPL